MVGKGLFTAGRFNCSGTLRSSLHCHSVGMIMLQPRLARAACTLVAVRLRCMGLLGSTAPRFNHAAANHLVPLYPTPCAHRPEIQECVLQMPPAQAAAHCNADPDCKAFILKQRE